MVGTKGPFMIGGGAVDTVVASMMVAIALRLLGAPWVVVVAMKVVVHFFVYGWGKYLY